VPLDRHHPTDSQAPAADQTAAETPTDFRYVGPKLHALGYPITVIRPESKAPFLEDWRQLAITQTADDVRRLAERYGSCGCGIVTSGTVGLDLDVLDKTAAVEIAELAWKMLGRTPARFGRAPKMLLPYRTEGTIKGSIATRKFRDSTEQKHRVEWIINTQFVAFGRYPGIGRPYSWHGGSPLDIAANDLPLVTESQMREFIAEAEELLLRHGFEPEQAATTTVVDDAPLPGSPPAVMINGASGSLLAAQANVPGDWFDALPTEKKNSLVWALARHLVPYADESREKWLPKFAAFHDAFLRGATEGEAAAFWWCRTSKLCNEADIANSWAKFHPAGPGDSTIATLIKLGADTGFDFSPWRSGPQPSVPASTTVVITGAPASQMPREMDEVTGQAELGARFSKAASYGGKPTFIRHNPDGTIERRKPEDLQVELSGHFVESVGGQGKKEQVGAARYLMNNPPRVFDRIVYDPPGSNLTRPGEVTFNLWRSFDVAPAQGDWRLMRQHIWRTLCGQDAAAFKYLVCWLADLVQNPGRCPEVMVILKSKLGGHGKSLLGKWLLRIFGLHGLEVTDPEQVFGEFTANLEAKSFVLLEELTFPGDHRNSAKVKALITAKTVRINGKNTPSYYVPNTLHYMVTTNEAWAIAADAGARRYFVLDIKDDKSDAEGRRYYQELVTQAENGGVAAMLYDLLLVDLSKFDIRDVPVTDALIDQQRRSADDISKWIIDCVVTGEIIPGTPNGGFGAAWPPARIHQSYVTWCQAQGTRRPKVAQIFGKSLSAMGFTRSKTNNPPTWTVPDPAKLLAAADRQEGIRKKRGRR
jgi:hypothetical protein